MEKIQPQFPRRSAGTGCQGIGPEKRRCVKTGAPVQSSICAARSIAISCAGNAPCTTAIPTAKITLLPYADALPRRLMFAYHSGKLENENITYHDTWEIFEHDGVTSYNGDLPHPCLRSATRKRPMNCFLCAFRERRVLDEAFVKELQRKLTHGTL